MEEAATSEIDLLAIGTLSNGEASPVAANVHYVTAVRMSNQQMKLTGWHVLSSGEVEREGDAVTTGTVKNLAISDGQAFVTAAQDGEDNLKVGAWSVIGTGDNNIHNHAVATGSKASRVVVAKLAGTGLHRGRAVTGIRNALGQLQLNVWDFDNQAGTLINKATKTADPISEVAVRTLRYKDDVNQTTRFVTATRNGNGKLQVDLWEVSATGTITRKGGEETGDSVSDLSSSRNKIAIGEWGTEKFYVAFIQSNGKLRLISWTTDTGASGALEHKGEYEASGKTGVAITGKATVLRKDDGDLQIINWKFDSGSGAIDDNGSADAGTVKLVAAGKVLTPVSLGSSSELKLINWEIVD